MKDFVIRAENLGKRYDVVWPGRGLGTQRPRNYKSKCAGEGWALRNVCFALKRGEMLGIIGDNGGGKTTLLKILSRITPPSEGRVEIRGRTGVLLDIGAGFHGELTGRENVRLFASILGMTRREIQMKYDEIVAFAETGHAMDLPLKHFSTGMCARLAFATAAHLGCDILLVDEVLALADQQYQQKCLRKLSDAVQAGSAMVMVSHDMEFIAQLCGRALLLQRGRIAVSGPALEVIACYREAQHQPQPNSVVKTHTNSGAFKCN